MYDSLPIWVKLPNLPFELRSVEFFKLIGNALGTYLEVDLSFLESGVCCFRKVLVLLDLRNGLAADIVIKKGEYVYTQPLEYMGVPFRCKRCHSCGHLLAQCHLPFLKNHFVSVPKSKSVWRVKKNGMLLDDLPLSVMIARFGIFIAC